MIKSLFTRMRIVHWVGIALLIFNALFFTDNVIGQIVQFVIAFVIFIHDLDEKFNGVEPAKKMIAFLQNFKLGSRLDFSLVYSLEFETMKNLGYSTSQAWDKLYEITGEKRNEEAVISR